MTITSRQHYSESNIECWINRCDISPMPVFDYVGQNNDKVWLKYSYEYRVYWSHIPQVSLVRGPHHLASSEVDASTQKIDLTDVVNGRP